MKDIYMTVAYNREIAPGIMELKLTADESLPLLHCGQFLHLEVPRADLLLRRPFCLFEYGADWVTLIVAVVGKGTEALAGAKPGTRLKAILPLGNGFKPEEAHKRIVLLGGGVGSAPLLAVPKCYPDKRYYTYLGFPDRRSVLFEEKFRAVSERFTLCTDDGSAGKKGYPTDALDEEIAEIRPDVILTCGSEPMLKAVARLSAKHKIPAYMSGESRMGCGVGACLVCTCAVRQKDGTVRNLRACTDGPVFSLEDIEL